jgi:glutathione S-transferase
MKVHGHPLSSCTRKVLVTLAEKGEAAELIKVDLFTGEHKTSGHIAKHPFGVIPVLDDDGFMLFESRAIIRYLDARFPDKPLTPASPRDIARMDQWLSVDQSYVAPYTRALAVERILKKHQGRPADPANENAAEIALGAALGAIDRALEGRTFLAGEAFSLADISLMPYVASLPMIGAAHLMDDRSRLDAWWTRVRARDSWKRAVESDSWA